MCLWVYDQLVWPRRAGGSEPKHLAPPNVRREYDETSQTLEASPRGAAALLRLAIEKLCKELGVTGESLKDDIAFFVREDVDARVQKVLDAARIIESNAVRLGQIGRSRGTCRQCTQSSETVLRPQWSSGRKAVRD